MDGEDNFGAVYKRLIDGCCAPTQARAEAVLHALLCRLFPPDPSGTSVPPEQEAPAAPEKSSGYEGEAMEESMTRKEREGYQP